jgi:hypothetical protein
LIRKKSAALAGVILSTLSVFAVFVIYEYDAITNPTLPFAEYGGFKINTKCQFTYFVFQHLTLDRKTISPNLLRDVYDYQTQRYFLHYLGLLKQKYGVGENQTVQLNNLTTLAYEYVVVPHFMNKYKINPKLKLIVTSWLEIIDQNSPSDYQITNRQMYSLLHPTTEDIQNDLQCVDKLQNNYGDVLNNFR